MIVVVPIDPSPDSHLPGLEGVLSPADRRRLAESAAVDVARAVTQSGGDLLVNYREPDDGDRERSEATTRELLADVDVEDARFEHQVGSTRSARVGNTVTHLLREEEAASVGVLEPTAPLVVRPEIDGAAMKIRGNDVVLGPAPDGEVYLAAFAETIDFADAYTSPELSTIAGKAREADLGIGFAPMLPTVETEAGLRSTIAAIDARRAADRPVPEATAAVLEDVDFATDNAF